jgi:hypothetical protein
MMNQSQSAGCFGTVDRSRALITAKRMLIRIYFSKHFDKVGIRGENTLESGQGIAEK